MTMLTRTLGARSGILHFAAEYPVSVAPNVRRLTDFDFLIALTAMRNRRYLDFYKAERDPLRYVILDSGVFEDPSNPPSCVKQLNLATELDADEVVPVDEINCYTKTIKNMEEFLSLSSSFPFRIQGVVQGSSLIEWLRCFWEFHDNPRVDVIGLTYFEVPQDLKSVGMTNFDVPDAAEQARLVLLNLIAGGIGVRDTAYGPVLDYRGPISKPIHLLGCRHARALRYYLQYPMVRSIDTSFPVQLGIEGLTMHLDSPKPTCKVNFAGEPQRAEVALINMNVFRFLSLCRGQDSSASWEFTDRVAGVSIPRA